MAKERNVLDQRQPDVKSLTVFERISAIAGELAKEGISKSRENQQQHYKFRGIDDVYNALAPLLAKYEVCIIPRVRARECSERKSKNDTVIFSVVVTVDYLISCSLGDNSTSETTATIIGEAMDSGDKATNKAMSAAYKYLCLQTFCIPTEGESPDADKETHEVKSSQPTVSWGDIKNITELITQWNALPKSEQDANAQAFKDRRKALMATEGGNE